MQKLNEGTVLTGFFWGVMMGGIVALFRAPRVVVPLLKQGGLGQSLSQLRQARAEMRQRLEAAVESALPTDPISESIAEGKAAARRRLSEIGYTATTEHPPFKLP